MATRSGQLSEFQGREAMSMGGQRTERWRKDPSGNVVHQDASDLLGHHLTAERTLVTEMVCRGGYHTVVELGGDDGHWHLSNLLDLGVRYLGLSSDEEATRVARGVIAAKGALAHQASVLHYHSDERRAPLAELLDLGHRVVGDGGVLVLLPMNMLGVLADPEQLFQEVHGLSADLCVMTFGTCQRATSLRCSLYEAWGRKGLGVFTDTLGVCVTDRAGGHTYAYHPGRVAGWVMNNGFDLRFSPAFGSMGRAFWARTGT